jgi:hypothetical protein
MAGWLVGCFVQFELSRDWIPVTTAEALATSKHDVSLDAMHE